MAIKYTIIDLFREILRLTIYSIAKVIPKQKNLWIFGAWKGEKYSDNSKYLFEFVAKNNPEIEVVWMTQNKAAYTLVKQAGYPVVYFGSIKAIWKCMRAEIAITCVDAVTDLPSYALSGQTRRVQLWHGLGPKGYRFTNTNSRTEVAVKNMSLVSKIINKIVLSYGYILCGTWYNGIKWLPYYLIPKQDLVVTTSPLGKEKMQHVFGELSSRIEILGYPRHDSLVSVTKKEMGHAVRVFYAPTHRSESQGEVLVKIDELYQALREHPKVTFITKLHDLAVVENEKLDLLRKLPNFELLTETQIAQDVYTILPTMDILITDYSSIYTDFLLLKRPIIFVPFDKTEYKNNDQGFFMDYDQITPGPKAKNWQEAMKYIATYTDWQGKYEGDQNRVLDLFHTIRDGHSSERITQKLLELGDEVPDRIPN
jgi:CDP-glycerol glycerophosphotransferase (TagB/SpsB family)